MAEWSSMYPSGQDRLVRVLSLEKSRKAVRPLSSNDTVVRGGGQRLTESRVGSVFLKTSRSFWKAREKNKKKSITTVIIEESPCQCRLWSASWEVSVMCWLHITCSQLSPKIDAPYSCHKGYPWISYRLPPTVGSLHRLQSLEVTVVEGFRGWFKKATAVDGVSEIHRL